MSADVDAEGLGECFNLKPYRNLVKASWAPPPPTPQKESFAAPAATEAPAEEAEAPVEDAAAAPVEGEGEPAESIPTAAAADSDQPPVAEPAEPTDATAATADPAAASEGEVAAAAAVTAAEPVGGDEAPVGDAPIDGDGASPPSSSPPPVADYEEGAPNAFRITLFCLAAQYDACAQDFWLHAFSCFPQREYGCLTVPSAVLAEPTLVKGLTAAATWPGVSFSHTLYVVHRDVLLAPRHLTVQRWLPSQAQVWCDNILLQLPSFGVPCHAQTLASLYGSSLRTHSKCFGAH